MKSIRKVIVIGAGISGLTLAYKLSSAGYNVVLVEKEARVGGLAKNYEYDGGYVFDPGPHRFYSENPEVVAFISEILEGDQLRIRRNSGVRMFDRYLSWPLTLPSIFRMPPSVLLSVGRDLWACHPSHGPSFEEYIVSRYGRTLYAIFFKPYTEKFLGLPCSEISKDWAITGIDRAIIDRNMNVKNLISLATSLIVTRPPLEFIYPKSGGIGIFSDRMAGKIMTHSGHVLLNTTVQAIRTREMTIQGVVINDREYDCDLLVWTGSLADIASLLGRAKTSLQYLSLLIYNYCLNTYSLCPYQWCYFGAADVPFNRISIPTQFNPTLAPPGKAGVCVEVTCRQGDDLWNDPAVLEERIRKALVEHQIIRGRSDIVMCRMERLSNAYPIYTLDYAEQFSQAKADLQYFSNLRLLGRTASFWYNNMDHSIDAALRLFREITEL